MTVRKNRYYNDPAIGEAFDNLASTFKVPSGSDLSGYANAAATRAKSQRLSELFRQSQDRSISRDTLDRTGLGAGVWAPNQSFYSVDQGNATSRANNAADNARALSVARLQDQGNTTRTLLGPVGAGQTRFVPPSVAQMYVLPEHQVGAIESKPGEITTAPDGRVFRGDPAPLTLDQAKAREMQGLRQSGAISDDMMRAAIFGNTPLEIVQTADGPRNVFRPDAVGQAPQPDPSKQSELSILQSERDRIRTANPNDQRIVEYNNRIQALGRGQQQDEYSKGIDKSLVELGEGIFKNAQTAYSNVATLDRLDQLLGEVGSDQGKFASVKMEVRRALNSLGIEAGDTSPADRNKFGRLLPSLHQPGAVRSVATIESRRRSNQDRLDRDTGRLKL